MLTCSRSGVWDGLSPDDAKQMYPDEWERFLSDPYAHRAPRAESYHDLSGESRLRRILHSPNPCSSSIGTGHL